MSQGSEISLRIAITAREQEEAKRLEQVCHSCGFKEMDIFFEPRQTLDVAIHSPYQIFLSFQNFPDLSGLTMMQTLRENRRYGVEPHLLLVDRLEKDIIMVLADHHLKYILPKPHHSDQIYHMLDKLKTEEAHLSEQERKYRQAYFAFRENEFDKALNITTHLMKEHELQEKYFLLLGDSFLGLNQIEEAKKVYNAAQKSYPTSLGPTHKKARVLMKERRFPEASQVLKALTTQSPLNIEILSQAGICHFEAGDYEEAKKAMTQLKSLDHRRKDASTTLGKIALRERDIKFAVKNLNKVLSPSEMIDLIEEEAQHLRSQHAYLLVIDLYRESIESLTTSPQLYQLYFALGNSYQQVLDLKQAEESWRKCLQLETHFQPAIEALQQLLSPKTRKS